MVVVLTQATVGGGVVHPIVPKVRLHRIGVSVCVHVPLCAAEMGEVTGGEVLVKDLPNVMVGKLFGRAEWLVQS